ncbi:unnamed protein product [Chrysoparadoxa australica]
MHRHSSMGPPGVLVAADGAVYRGDFIRGQYDGEGELKTAEGDVMAGSWKHGKLSGKASIAFSIGTIYKGMMQSGEYHGKGKLTYNKGRGWYEGSFYRGSQQGYGIRQFMNGNTYEGAWVDGEPHGEGVMHYANGDAYVGEWSQGKQEGRGVVTTTNGDRYEGQFMAGLPYGEGKYMWRDGGYYEGEYMALKKGRKAPSSGEFLDQGTTKEVLYPSPDGRRNGHGIRVWVSGARYEGSWVDDKMEGKGVYTHPEGGMRYEGNFHNQLRHGNGSCRWGNKHGTAYQCPLGIKHDGRGYCVFQGDWWIGEMHKGTFQCADGRIWDGQWKNSRLQGYGSAILMLQRERGDPQRMFIGGIGSLYRFYQHCGRWKHGKKEGFGVGEYANGDRVIGNYKDGLPEDICLHVFGTNLKLVPARWSRGRRESWLEWDDVDESKLMCECLASIKKDPLALITGQLQEVQRVGEVLEGPKETVTKGEKSMAWVTLLTSKKHI